MNLPKELTTVTPLSRYLAMFLFIVLPFLGFYLGMDYQQRLSSMQPILQYQSALLPSDHPTVNQQQSLSQSPTMPAFRGDTLVGPYDPLANLTINIGLPPKNQPTLDYIIQSGRTISQSDYKTMFGPTDNDVSAIETWSKNQGLTVRSVSPDNMLISVDGTVALIERAFKVQINDYKGPDNSTYYMNAQSPTYPNNLDIQSISGLSNKSMLQSGR